MIGAGARESIPNLIGALDNNDPEVEVAAANALGSFGPEAKSAIPKLCEVGATEGQPGYAALGALTLIGSDSVPCLLELYRLQPRRSQVARAFVVLRPKAAAAIPLLVADVEKNAAAAEALGSMGDAAKSTVRKLEKALQAENSYIRLRAAEALWRIARLTNEVMPIMIEQLTTWSCQPSALTGETSHGEGHSEEQIAAGLLAEIGPVAKDALPLLRLLNRSQYENQRSAATRALTALQLRLE